MIGKTLAHFRVVDKLGEGGMGEVYRAEDTKLGREVAIKVLPEAVAGNPERLARFEREAKVLAALNHSNIAAIYSLESAERAGTEAGPYEDSARTAGAETGRFKEAQGAGAEAGRFEDRGSVDFLVMELAEGEDLADRIGRGPIAVEETLSIAFQIAEALEAAHERGIIHRDLKPANIKVDDEGRVKVLDFGLAKALDPTEELEGESFDGQRISASLSPTLTAQMTSAGVILGTAAYMSPEQAKGKTVDKRSDIWAFGLVCFEMLTGKRLFAADSVAETLAGVIKTEVDFDELPNDLAPSFRRLLRRCLEREPRRRLHDIADGRIVIEDIQSGTAEETFPITEPAPESPAGWRKFLPYLVGALGLAAGLWALSTTWIAEPPAPRSETALQFGVHAPPQMELSSGFAISPDGEHLVFVARDEGGRTMLWLRRLDSVEARPLGGTTEARYPFWSPDSLQVGYFAQGQLQITDLISDSPRALASTSTAVNVRGATWGADDTIVYAPSYTGGFMRISASGGEPEPATRIPDDGSIGTHRFPAFLSDGHHFVFYASAGGGTEPGALYLGKLGSLDAVELGPSSSRAVFADPDHLLYVRGEALVAHRFDRVSLKLEGEPASLGITLPGSLAVSGYRSLAISSAGLLVHRRETRGTTSLKMVNREGEEIELLPADREAWQYAPRLSPDGKQLLIARYGDTMRGDLWIQDLERGIASRFPIEEGDESLPAWSPDQQWIAYDSIRNSPQYGIYVAPVGRADEERLLVETGSAPGANFWTPDGQSLVYEVIESDGEQGFWKLAIDGSGQPEPFLPEPAPQSAAVLSPDGGWVAYGSNASGRVEIYVRAFDGSGAAIRVSAAGGGQPLWGRDGRELFYLNATNEIVVVPVSPGNPPVFGRPEVLFRTRIEETTDRQYDVTPDGQHFIVNESTVSLDEPIIVTTDWQRLLALP